MNYNKLIETFDECSFKVIPIIKGKEDIKKINYKASLIEYVYRKKDSKNDMLELDKTNLSIGTILTIDEAKFCINNGINIMFSPHFDKKLVQYCLDNNSILIPGVFTASEIMEAYNIGVKVMKFFPCHSQDNVEILKQYSNIFDKLDIKFIATGGINYANYKDILDIKNVIAVGSSKLLLL